MRLGDFSLSPAWIRPGQAAVVEAIGEIPFISLRGRLLAMRGRIRPNPKPAFPGKWLQPTRHGERQSSD